MEFAHAAHHRLAGLGIHPHLKRRVLRLEFRQRLVQLLGSRGVPRLNRNRDDGLGRENRLEGYRLFLIAKGVARSRFLHAGYSDDIARPHVVYALALVGIHPEKPGEALTVPSRGVPQAVAHLGPAAIDPQVREPPAPIYLHLEDQSGKRRILSGWTRNGFFLSGRETARGAAHPPEMADNPPRRPAATAPLCSSMMSRKKQARVRPRARRAARPS